MNETETIQRLNVKIEELEQELQTQKLLVWANIQSSVGRHRIGTKAATIRRNVELIRGDLEGAEALKQISNSLDRIERSASEITNKSIAPLTAADNETQIFKVNDFLYAYKHRIQEHYSDIQINLELELFDLASVKASPEWIQRIIDIVIENAVTAMQESSEKIITLSASVLEDKIKISISDTGPGVPNNVRSKLFRMLITGKERRGSLGIGLLLAKMIVQVYGGDIWLAQSKQHNPTFVVSLPRP